MSLLKSIYSLDMEVAASSPCFVDLLEATSPVIASSGAAAGNSPTFNNVSFQRNADYTALVGFQQNSSSEIAQAISAMQFGFAEEQPDGSFLNPGITVDQAYNDPSADAFFLQSAVQLFLDVKNSPFWPSFSAQLQAFKAGFSNAMNRLLAQSSILSQDDARKPNHLFFDSIAYELGGQLLGNSSMIQTGEDFVNQALATQTTAGYFTENGGWDSSYNGTSMLCVEILMTYSANSSQVTQLSTALSNALAWEETRIQANGGVSTVGNTRTAGQEMDLNGAAKTVDYEEVALSLLYAGAMLNAPEATSLGNAVASYGLMEQGGVAQPLRPTTFTTITPDSSGVAGGDGRNDILKATGPGQSLVETGGGGEVVFNIGAYANTNLTVSGDDFTQVNTSATIFTLPPGIDNLAVSGSRNHTIVGNSGENYIVGSNANDTIDGGGGSDVIKVGTGSNTLTGGGEYDVFAFPSSSDQNNIITDFQQGYDALDLRAMFAAGGWSAANSSKYIVLSQQGANAVFSVNPTGTGASGDAHVLVTLDNVAASQLVAGVDYLV